MAVHDPDDERVQPPALGEALELLPEAHDLEIVHIEDDPDHAEMVELMLETHLPVPHRLRRFPTLNAARESLSGSDACVLLDLSLPDARGVESVQSVQKLAPEAPIVVFSSSGEQELAREVVRRGAQNYLVKGETNGAALARAISHAVERKRLERALTHLASHDALTGLPNRSMTLETLRRALSRAERVGGAVAVLFCDLDGFKAINDTHGHDVGDAALAEAARRIASAIRAGDLAGRIGGDEFAVICEDDRELAHDELIHLGHRIAEHVRRPVSLGGLEIELGASIGIAVSRGESEAERLIAQADAAMYEAKRDPAGVRVATGRARRIPSTAVVTGFVRVYSISDATIVALYAFPCELRADRRPGPRIKLDPAAGIRIVEDTIEGALDLLTTQEALTRLPSGVMVDLPRVAIGDAGETSRLVAGLAEFPSAVRRAACFMMPAEAVGSGAAELAAELRRLGVRVGVTGLDHARLPLDAITELSPDVIGYRLDPAGEEGGGDRVSELSAVAAVAGVYGARPLFCGLLDRSELLALESGAGHGGLMTSLDAAALGRDQLGTVLGLES